MVLRVIATNVAAQVNLTTVDDVFVAAGAVVEVVSTAIEGIGSNHSALIAGRVSSTSNFLYGIQLGDSETLDSGNSVEVISGGSIFSNYLAVLMMGAGSTLTNSGTIAGGSYGVDFFNGVAGTTDTLINSGTIVSEVAILRNSWDALGSWDIFNSGTIIGYETSFDSWDAIAVDRIYNKGRMDGNIEFDGGNDLYDGRGGSLKGTAFGGAGNDTFIGGSGVERFDGGIDHDKFTGGLGKDRITTGAGNDKIIFNSIAEIGDIVADFTTTDLFQFKKSAFGNLTLGTLSSAAYRENNTGFALDASDRFIMDIDDGRLYYDRDGNGAAARVLVADTNVIVGNFSRADIEII